MPPLQSFRSEAYKNGQRYLFEARFDASLWTAVIRDESGRRRGAISCESHQPQLRGDELEDAVCDWVHRAVDYNVGFSEEQSLSGRCSVNDWTVTSALQAELARARSVRSELALTMAKFKQAYVAYSEQVAEIRQCRGIAHPKAKVADETVSARDVAFADHRH